MKIKLIASLGLVIMLLAMAGTALAWDGGVNASRDCNGVTVTANPENPYWEDHSGKDQVKWVVSNVSGTGFFPWNGAPRLEGDVVVTWTKYVSSNWGISWTNTGQTHPETYHWSKNKPNNCATPTNTPTPTPTATERQHEILKIDVCHATASESNPYTKNNVNINSVEDANQVGGHGQHGGDIWAPYTYEGVDYPGQGDQSILNNDCEVPEEPTNTPTNTPTPEENTPTPTNTEPATCEEQENCPTNTPTPTPTATKPDEPTGTPAPTATPTPVGGCDDPQGRWQLHGVIKDANGNALAVTGGNFYHVFFKMVEIHDGVVTADDLGMYDFPTNEGSFAGGGYLPNQNFDRLSVTVMDINGKVYPAAAYSIHSQTKERLADQQQYIGTYCAEMWLEVIVSTDGAPLPPQPLAEQPTPAPLQETGGAPGSGWLIFGGLLLLAAAIGGASFGAGAKKQ